MTFCREYGMLKVCFLFLFFFCIEDYIIVEGTDYRVCYIILIYLTTTRHRSVKVVWFGRVDYNFISD